MPTHSDLDKVTELLASGKTEDAADLLLELAKGTDEVHYNSALMLKNQLEQLQQDVIDGVVSDSEQRLNWAKISRRIIELTRQIEKGEGPKKLEEILPTDQKAEPAATLPKWALWAVPIVLLVSLIVIDPFSANKPVTEGSVSMTESENKPAVKTIPFDGKLIYNDGSPAGNIEVEIIPISEQVSMLTKEIRFRTNMDGTFKAGYPEIMLEKGNGQVNIYFRKDGTSIDKRINNRFMPINFQNMTILSPD